MTKYADLFTVISAIFAIINAVVVIFLMVWLHRKESNLSLLPLISELRKNLIEIHHTLSSEIEYFKENKYDNQIILNEKRKSGFKVYHCPYRHEIKNLNLIIDKMEILYKKIVLFRNKLQSYPDMDLETYKRNSQIVESINEILALHKPSAEYKKGLFTDDDLDADAEAMIDAAKENSLNSINRLIELLDLND
ncbi:hypothetical protein HXZ60_02290 [Acinetobacter towneri]|uniref:hypothetical protein n=1 Tax=Acinetobacter towneri TaxID=202956 RepID=UPI0025769D8D|nr:hypothetical protein [Acinetobacter towneri]MDM1282429.1 hypothetical protein [Acinetobacter towneri]